MADRENCTGAGNVYTHDHAHVYCTHTPSRSVNLPRASENAYILSNRELTSSREAFIRDHLCSTTTDLGVAPNSILGDLKLYNIVYYLSMINNFCRYSVVLLSILSEC